jgi:hypothetical protein
MSNTTIGAMSLTVCVTLLGVFAGSPRAQNAGPVPLAKAIVGTWRGDAIFARQATNVGSVGLEIRFTDDGAVTVRREPVFPSRPAVDSWTGDYIVPGHVNRHQPPCTSCAEQRLRIPARRSDGREQSSRSNAASRPVPASLSWRRRPAPAVIASTGLARSQ